MTYGELRTLFQTTLNRDDCTNVEADALLVLGLSRLQRECEAPFMERSAYVIPTLDGIGSWLVPGDYLRAITMLVDGVPADRVSYRVLAAKAYAARPGLPGERYQWARFGGTFYLSPTVPVNSRLEILYHGAATPIASDAGTNEVLSAAPDLWLYAGLTYAADRFRLDQRAELEARYQAVLAQVNGLAASDEMSGGPQAVLPYAYDPGTL